MTAIGDRDTKIVFQRATVTKDANGGPVESWATYVTEWAAVKFGSGQERREAQQEAASQSASFRVLANTLTRALKPTDRIAGYLGVNWDIITVALFDGAEVEVTAVRKAA